MSIPGYKLLVLSLTLMNFFVIWAYYLTVLGFSFPISQMDSSICPGCLTEL